jgi:hypothetical protein
MRKRGTQSQPISEDDVQRAIKKVAVNVMLCYVVFCLRSVLFCSVHSLHSPFVLIRHFTPTYTQVLGNGFTVLTAGARRLVVSVPVTLL